MQTSCVFMQRGLSRCCCCKIFAALRMRSGDFPRVSISFHFERCTAYYYIPLFHSTDQTAVFNKIPLIIGYFSILMHTHTEITIALTNRWLYSCMKKTTAVSSEMASVVASSFRGPIMSSYSTPKGKKSATECRYGNYVHCLVCLSCSAACPIDNNIM